MVGICAEKISQDRYPIEFARPRTPVWSVAASAGGKRVRQEELGLNIAGKAINERFHLADVCGTASCRIFQRARSFDVHPFSLACVLAQGDGLLQCVFPLRRHLLSI